MTPGLQARTRDHLAAAERNRSIAGMLLESDPSALQPPPFEWVVVLAFYSAVHLVNALVWQRMRHEPRDHRDRHMLVDTLPELRACRASYARLRGLGFRARYIPLYRVADRQATTLVDVDLATIERAVYSALGLSSPPR